MTTNFDEELTDRGTYGLSKRDKDLLRSIEEELRAPKANNEFKNFVTK